MKLGTHLVGTGFVWDPATQRSVVAVALPSGARAGSTVHLGAKKFGTSGLDARSGMGGPRMRLQGVRLVIDVGELDKDLRLDLFHLDGSHVAGFVLNSSNDHPVQISTAGMPRGMLLANFPQNARVREQRRILLP